jgi:polysaccharide biosynthesis protein PslG
MHFEGAFVRIKATIFGEAVKILRYLFFLTILGSALTACLGGGDERPTPVQASLPAGTSVVTHTPTSEASSDSSPVGTAAESGGGTAAPSATPSTPQATPTARTTPTPQVEFGDSSFAYGWNVGLRGDDETNVHNGRVADLVNESGSGWVRFQMPWFQMEPANGQWDPLPFDRMIDSMNAAGLNILIVVAKAPDWALSEDPDTYISNMAEFEQFMAFVSERYSGKVQAWEIWNEQNLAHEWGGHVNVDEYVKMLEAGSRGVRTGNPEALVVFGGLTPNGVNDPSIAIDDFNFLNLAYLSSGGTLGQYFDVLGVHANSTHNSPDENYPGPLTSGNQGWNDHPSFFFRRVEQLRQVMVDQGDVDKPVWITEFGWTTENQAPGYEYGANNSEEEVAQYLTRAYEIAVDEWSWCTGAFVWNLNWSTLVDPSDEKYPWSAVNGDWSPRPQFEAVKNVPK